MDQLSNIDEALLQRIERGQALVGIIGMGYVGLPLMLAATERNFHVIGFDTDVSKINGLNNGRSPLKHILDTAIMAVRTKRLFEATADFSRLKECDVIVICVPTPLGRHHEPDLSFVVETAKTIAGRLRRGQLVVLEFDHLSRHDHRNPAATSRSQRSKFRKGLLPGVLTGARGPR